MIPSVGYITDLTSDVEANNENQTFELNFNENIIGGKVNDLDALKQSIYLMLSVEADQYIIYPYTYGVNTLDLIGKPYHYVVAVLPDRITKTLLSDDRITEVTDFEFEINRNKIGVTFIVHTIYGDIQSDTVVIY